jgi:hypothetical protein
MLACFQERAAGRVDLLVVRTESTITPHQLRSKHNRHFVFFSPSHESYWSIAFTIAWLFSSHCM